MAAIVRAALLMISIVAVLSPSEAAGGRLVGGRMEVKDVADNKEIQSLGKFSVREYNRRQATNGGKYGGVGLTFSRVVEAQTQVVSGIKYYLRIEVKTPGGGTRMFDSVVVVKPWRHYKELVDFAPVTPAGFIKVHQ